jgi:hypothetical protein
MAASSALRCQYGEAAAIAVQPYQVSSVQDVVCQLISLKK